VTFERIFTIVISILSLSAASGLIFAILIQPRRDTISYLFGGFSSAVAVWGLIAFVVQLAQVDFTVQQRLLATVIGTGTLFLLPFTIRFTSATDKVSNLLAGAAPLVYLICLVLLWIVPTHSETGLTPVGYALVAVFLVYAAFPLWVVLSSRGKEALVLRLPTLIILIGYVSVTIPTLNQYQAGLLLTTIGAAWIGWIILRLQMFNPINDLSNELRIANRDLRQALADLGSTRAQLDVLNRELLAASGYKGEFLTNMSHKLRTPLYSIAGYTELLQSGVYGELNEKQIDRLDKIQRNGKTLLELINNMLDLSKMEAGRLELQTAAFQLDAIVDQSMVQFESMAKTKQIKLNVDLPADLTPLYGDMQRIQQVISQLIDNAIKFTDQGAVLISASNVHVKQGNAVNFRLPFSGWLSDGDWVIISVQDTGIGIPPEFQARIFDEFFQVDEQKAAELGGTGLGLHIAKRLIEMHKGVIWLRSQPSQGSTFFVALPSHHEARVRQTGTFAVIQ
jgi:signal transduction histidine kinase